MQGYTGIFIVQLSTYLLFSINYQLHTQLIHSRIVQKVRSFTAKQTVKSNLSVGELESTQASSTIRWKIPNFSSVDVAVRVVIRSPDFHTTLPYYTGTLPWRLRLYPSGTEEGSNKYMGLFLSYLGSFQVKVSYSFSILNEEHGEMCQLISTTEASYDKRQSRGTNKYCLRAIVFDKVNKALVNDTLVISCTITAKNTALNVGYNDPDANVRAHFENLMESGDLSDVTFEIGTKKMRLHQAIVTSLSPVFMLAMFQNEMREKKESVVQIPDVKYEVMKELFRYIYVRKVKGIESIAADLFVAADKYDVQGLKMLCEDILFQSLNIDNALKLLEFALKYNTTFLKLKAIEFIVGRLKEFVDKPEIVQMEGVCKDELLRAIARQN